MLFNRPMPNVTERRISEMSEQKGACEKVENVPIRADKSFPISTRIS